MHIYMCIRVQVRQKAVASYLERESAKCSEKRATAKTSNIVLEYMSIAWQCSRWGEYILLIDIHYKEKIVYGIYISSSFFKQHTEYCCHFAEKFNRKKKNSLLFTSRCTRRTQPLRNQVISSGLCLFTLHFWTKAWQIYRVCPFHLIAALVQ